MIDTLPVGSKEYELAQRAKSYLPESGHPTEETCEVFRNLPPEMLDMAFDVEGEQHKDRHMIYLIAKAALQGRRPPETSPDYLRRTEIGLAALGCIIDMG